MSLVEALHRVDAARRFVHGQQEHRQDRYPCISCPSLLVVAASLDLLAERPRDAKSVRRVLHDAVCASGCGPESDHADRTQAATAATLRRFCAQESA